MSADVDVLIVGAGHGGLGVAARLLERQRDVLLVDANARVGDPWRQRWTSLRLFTPRFYNALPGVPFPGGADPFPGTDEVAEYHERYARVLGAPLLLGRRVTRLRRTASAFEAEAGGDTIRARSVVIATGAHHTPRIPKFASALGTGVTQLHSRDYGTFGPLPPGPVLVVGARNSGAEIAVEVARTHPVTIALGTQPPQAPARWRSPAWWRISAARSRLLRGARGPSARTVVVAVAARGPHVPGGRSRASRARGTPTDSASCRRCRVGTHSLRRRPDVRASHGDMGDWVPHRRHVGRGAVG